MDKGIADNEADVIHISIESEEEEDAAFLHGRPARRAHVLETFSLATRIANP